MDKVLRKKSVSDDETHTYAAMLYLPDGRWWSLAVVSRSRAIVTEWVKLKTALSLLDFARDHTHGLLVVFVGCGSSFVVVVVVVTVTHHQDLELVLVVRELVFDSLNFLNVPLAPMSRVDFFQFGHRIHCDFVWFFFEKVAIFERMSDTIPWGNV